MTITINTKKETELTNYNSENDSNKKLKKSPVKNVNCIGSNFDATNDNSNVENCEVMSTDSSMSGSVHLIVDETSLNADLTVSQTQFTNENSFQIKEEKDERIETDENMAVDLANKQEDQMEIEARTEIVIDEKKESPCQEKNSDSNAEEISSDENKANADDHIEVKVNEANDIKKQEAKVEKINENQWIPCGDPLEQSQDETHKKFKSIAKNDVQIIVNDFVLIENKNLKKISTRNEDCDMTNQSRDTNYSDDDSECEYFVQLNEIKQDTKTDQVNILVRYLYKAKQLRDELNAIENNEEFDANELICTNQSEALLDADCIKSKCLIFNKADYDNWLKDNTLSKNGMQVFFYRYQYDFEQKTLNLIEKI